MLNHGSQLILARCPHCGVDSPSLHNVHTFTTKSFEGRKERTWVVYPCSRCGGVVLAASVKGSAQIIEMYPSVPSVHQDIPERAREYLQQAIDSVSAPAGSVILAASSVDAMLKAKGLKDGSLFKRIDQAAEQHLITKEMAQWAHDVRLDANDQRHSDEAVPLPTNEDAKRVIEFAQAFAMFLFVLPARVKRGLDEAKKK